MNLSGQLSDWSIDDLLRIMQVTHKTASLDISGDQSGRIHFLEGNVTGAALGRGDISTDREDVAEILYVLSSVDRGTFAVGPADGPDAGGMPVDDVLSDVSALKQLESEVADAGLVDAISVQLQAEHDEPLTVTPEDWRAIAALVESFSFAGLESRFGRGGAVRILHSLHQLGVIHATTAEDETAEEIEVAVEDEQSSEPTWLEQAQAEAPKHLAPADRDTSLDEQDESPEEPVADEPTRPLEPAAIRGVSAPASTTLTDGVYDEIRRLRSKAAEK